MAILLLAFHGKSWNLAHEGDREDGGDGGDKEDGGDGGGREDGGDKEDGEDGVDGVDGGDGEEVGGSRFPLSMTSKIFL